MSEIETLQMLNQRYERKQLPKVLTFTSTKVGGSHDSHLEYELDPSATAPPYIRKLFRKPLVATAIKQLCHFIGYKAILK